MALVTPQVAVSGCVSISSTDATAFKALRTAAATSTKGELVGRLRACSTDTAAQVLQFARNATPEGGVATDYVVGEVKIPAGAGTNGNDAWVDVLASLNGGNPITLAAGEVLKVRTKVAVTGKIDVTSEPCVLG